MTNPSKSSTRKCAGHNSRGLPCGKWAVNGATVCRVHGAAAPQVAQKAVVRAEVMAWGLTDETVDPADLLLRLVAQAGRRATRYALLLEEGFEDKQVAALIGTSWSEAGPSGEYIRGLAQLEAQERDRAAGFAAKAIAAGIAERQVRVSEQLGGQLVAFVRGLLVSLGLNPDDPEVREVVSMSLRSLSA